jgi:hypothetical protein
MIAQYAEQRGFVQYHDFYLNPTAFYANSSGRHLLKTPIGFTEIHSIVSFGESHRGVYRKFCYLWYSPKPIGRTVGFTEIHCGIYRNPLWDLPKSTVGFTEIPSSKSRIPKPLFDHQTLPTCIYLNDYLYVYRHRRLWKTPQPPINATLKISHPAGETPSRPNGQEGGRTQQPFRLPAPACA